MRLEAAALRLKGVRHGFFGREGGVSTGPFATLNVGLRHEAERANAQENRRRIAAALGMPPDRLAVARQVHGSVCRVVAEPWPPLAPPEADALATATPGMAVGVTTADCVPVLLADGAARVVGAAHAGWRGTLAGIIEATLDAMAGLGAAPDRMRAAIGPCIRRDSYEVGSELRGAFLAEDPEAAAFFAAGRGDRFLFDLPGYVAVRLAHRGVDRLEDVGLDTLSDPDRFFSYRRATLEGAGGCGLQLSVIALDGHP